jgi:hypothetical protein
MMKINPALWRDNNFYQTTGLEPYQEVAATNLFIKLVEFSSKVLRHTRHTEVCA